MDVTVINTTADSTATYSCSTGYSGDLASGEVTCQASGNWSNLGLQCTRYSSNSTSGEVICQDNGSWTTSELVCTIVDCNAPPTRANMQIAVSSSTFGGSAVYSCDTGYTPNTASGVTTCQADGSWRTSDWNVQVC
ncbi:hypothetical protein ScPMuIL_015912 [Solemya velum]